MSARARVEALLDAFSGRGRWRWDRALSLLLDAAVLEDEAA